jgi:hypothetical protein
MSPTPTQTKPAKAPKAKPVSAETPDPLEHVQTVVAIPSRFKEARYSEAPQ